MGFHLPDVPTCDYSIALHVDLDATNGAVTESDEDNNEILRPIHITQVRPDLHPTALSAPATATAASTITVNWSVENLGTGPAYEHRDSLWLSDKADGTGLVIIPVTETLIATPPSPLAPNAHYDLSAGFNVPAVQAGDYYLILKTDQAGYGQDVVESNEDNTSPRARSTSIPSPGARCR